MGSVNLLFCFDICTWEYWGVTDPALITQHPPVTNKEVLVWCHTWRLYRATSTLTSNSQVRRGMSPSCATRFPNRVQRVTSSVSDRQQRCTSELCDKVARCDITLTTHQRPGHTLILPVITTYCPLLYMLPTGWSPPRHTSTSALTSTDFQIVNGIVTRDVLAWNGQINFETPFTTNTLADTSQCPVARSPSCSWHPSACLATPTQCLCACTQQEHGLAHVSRQLLSNEYPPTCSTGSLSGSVVDMAITSITNAFSVTFCHLLWISAILHGHCSELMWRPLMATQLWWWWWRPFLS